MNAKDKERKRLHALRARPRLEVLEERLTPTSYTYHWVGSTNNQDWTTASNWTGGLAGQYPGPNDTAMFDQSNATVCQVNQATIQVGAIQSVAGYTQNIEILAGNTLDIVNGGSTSAGLTTSWVAGNITFDATTSSLAIEGNTSNTATFSGSGVIGPVGGQVGALQIFNGATVNFTDGFSAFGANITIGKMVDEKPTSGILVFDSSLTGNVTDNNNASITVTYGNLFLFGTSENAGGIVLPQSGSGGVITLGTLSGGAQGQMQVTNQGFVKEAMAIENAGGQLSITGGLHITGGANAPGQPYNDASYWHAGSGDPTLTLAPGSELKLDHEFYMAAGTVQLSQAGHAQIDASDAQAFQFNGGTIDVSDDTSTYLTLNNGPVTCSKLTIENKTNSTTCSYINLAGGATWALGGVPVVSSTLVAAPNVNIYYTIVKGATQGPSTTSTATGTGFGTYVYNGTDNKGGIKWMFKGNSPLALAGAIRPPQSAATGGTAGTAMPSPKSSAPVLDQRKSQLLLDGWHPVNVQAVNRIYSLVASLYGDEESGWAEGLLGDGSGWLLAPAVLPA